MEPTNVLIRVCILLLMQPAPLAGTATKLDNQHLSWLQDATRTPRGDGNLIRIRTASLRCGCNPHPSRGRQRSSRLDSRPRNHFKMQSTPPPTGTATSVPFGRYWGIAVDAARAPHGDGNRVMKLFFLRTTPIQPAPLAGTATTIISSLEFDTRRCNPHPSRGRQHSFKAETETCLHRDATRTPYGDGNLRILDLHLVAGRCNPHPLRGRQLIEPFILEFDPPMQPAPLAGTVTRSK